MAARGRFRSGVQRRSRCNRETPNRRQPRTADRTSRPHADPAQASHNCHQCPIETSILYCTSSDLCTGSSLLSRNVDTGPGQVQGPVRRSSPSGLPNEQPPNFAVCVAKVSSRHAPRTDGVGLVSEPSVGRPDRSRRSPVPDRQTSLCVIATDSSGRDPLAVLRVWRTYMQLRWSAATRPTAHLLL